MTTKKSTAKKNAKATKKNSEVLAVKSQVKAGVVSSSSEVEGDSYNCKMGTTQSWCC